MVEYSLPLSSLPAVEKVQNFLAGDDVVQGRVWSHLLPAAASGTGPFEHVTLRGRKYVPTKKAHDLVETDFAQPRKLVTQPTRQNQDKLALEGVLVLWSSKP